MTVYLVSPATTQEPIGGVRKIYDHVDILNAAGIDAAVIQGMPGYRPGWFANTTRIEYAPVEVHGDDILVWPEYLSQHVRGAGVRQVVFVQSAYGLFADADPDVAALNLSPPAVLAVAVVSEDSATFVKYGWPRHQPVILRPGVDPAVFHPGAARRQIAFSSRRRHRAARQVLGLLRARGALDGWALADIVGITQDQVAERLRESALFLSFSEREGLGLPPIEALASGCHVIGFTGIGGREIFDPRYTQAIAEDDIVAYAQAVERWLAGFDADAARQRGLEAASWVTARYSIADERSAVLDFYGRLLETPTVTGSTVVRAAETWGPHDRPRSNARRGLGQVRAGLRTMLGRF